MTTRRKRPDPDTLRGTGEALARAFNGPSKGGHHERDDHLGALAADAEFALLLAQLNDPPEAYRRAARHGAARQPCRAGPHGGGPDHPETSR